MRKKIAAANWKMNLTLPQAHQLLDEILGQNISLEKHQEVIFAVPFPYLTEMNKRTFELKNYYTAAQNCSDKKSGAYTGETSVEMLQSIHVAHVVIGHSERREYYHETNELLAQKVNMAIGAGITPIFCCGEPLSIREAEGQNEFVAKQLLESLYHLTADEIAKVVIAYEPIWAIGTGKTASSQQAQTIHAFIRENIAGKYGAEVADNISILYGGSVKAANAVDLFSQPDVDGGLVGGASLVGNEFTAIIKALPA